jgi:hypothetical protein
MEKKMADPTKTAGAAVPATAPRTAVATTGSTGGGGYDSGDTTAIARLLTDVLTRIQRDTVFTNALSDRAQDAIDLYEITSVALNPQPRATGGTTPLATPSV